MQNFWAVDAIAERDMLESNVTADRRKRRAARIVDRLGRSIEDVAISLDGDGRFDRHGKLDFIDNAVNRSSGTIHARATVPNPDFAITPGQFARLRVATGPLNRVIAMAIDTWA